MDKEFIKSRMIKDSAVLWTGMMAANVSNYLFHLLMGRFLGPTDYGILASLIALYYIIMVPTGTIQIVAAKFAADFKAESSYYKVFSLLKYLSKRLFLIGAGLFIIFILASKPISNFLNIDSVFPVILLGSLFLISYIVPVNRGVLQGLQDFFQLSLNFSIETVFKLVVGIGLVYAGFKVNGAIFGIAVGVLVAYGISFFPLKFLFQRQYSKVQIGHVLRYSVPVFISYMCLTAFYSVDIILAKHFFGSVQAGLYSGLAILGKIVVFASLAIDGVMFPVVAELHKQEKNHAHYLRYSLILVSAISGLIVLAYYIFPNFIIRVLFPQYLPVAPYLGIFGFAMFLLALSSVFVYYFLAIQKTGFVYFLGVIALLQAVLIWFFHSSIGQVAWIMAFIMAVLTLGVFFYYLVKRSDFGSST